jgi:cyclopropane-fatty-acyl-phospholipid synthase
VTEHAAKARFTCERLQALQPPYARSPGCWVRALRAHHDEAAQVASEQAYQRYIRYFAGSADQFRSGHIDVLQFARVK